MTDGTSQGLFIVVAIVIFGIFMSMLYWFSWDLKIELQDLFTENTKQIELSLDGIDPYDDMDGDGIINLEDTDLDGDDIGNIEEKELGSDYQNPISTPTDKDGDGVHVDYDADDKNPDLTYEFTPTGYFNFDKDTGTITGYTGKIETVIIPSEIDGVTVKHVGERAFYYLTEGGIENPIKVVIIPDTVESIGNWAFRFTNIEKVILPESLKTIGEYAFANTRIKELTLNEGLESIGGDAFTGLGIKEVVLPESLKTIGEYAFRWNNFKNISIPAKVESIGNSAFMNGKLEELTFAEDGKLTQIKANVFNNNQLKSVILPKYTTLLGTNAFSNNKDLIIQLKKGTQLGYNALGNVKEVIYYD